MAEILSRGWKLLKVSGCLGSHCTPGTADQRDAGFKVPTQLEEALGLQSGWGDAGDAACTQRPPACGRAGLAQPRPGACVRSLEQAVGDGGFPHAHPNAAECWGSAGCRGDGGQEVAGAEEMTGSLGALGLCTTASVLVHGPFITHRNPPLLPLQRLQGASTWACDHRFPLTGSVAASQRIYLFQREGLALRSHCPAVNPERLSCSQWRGAGFAALRA